MGSSLQNLRFITMSEFTFMFRGRETSQSREQQQQCTAKWTAWFRELSAKGHLKEPGHPLVDTGRVISSRKRIVSDGPFAEAKDIIGGYAVIVAADLNEAAELAKGCPILEVDGSVEVRELLTLGI